MKRFLSLILVAATLTVSFVTGFEGLTLKSDAAVNFQCGVNATWDLDENGVLTISGTGDMYDFTNTMFGESNYSNAPWNDFYRSIKKIVIEEGITNISEGAFINCKNATDLHIASSIEVIEGRNFDGQNPERITVGENSRLRTSSITFSNTKWFKSQPDDQPVYLGRMLLTYKYSTTPSSVEDYPTVNVKDGTISISERAFNNKPLKNITLPDSIVYVGSDAFAGTYWLQNQPAGPIYAGNTYIGYSGTIPFSENDFRLKEGTTCIAANAFSSTDRISSVYIPSSVTSICRSAFRLCYNLETVSFAPDSQLKLIDDYSFEFCDKLKSIDLPESIEYIGEEAFYDSMRLQKLHITKSLKRLGDNIGNIQKISIDPDNSNFFLDQNAFLYTRDKKELILSASDTNISEYTLQDNCVIIHPYAFCSLKADSIVLNQALKYIDACAFTTSYVKNVTIPYNTVVHSDSFFGNKTVTIHCYENSSAHKTAVIKGNPYVLLDGTVSDTKLKEAISKAEAIDRTLYTNDSLSKLDAAVSAVNLDADGLTQEMVNAWCEAIEKALGELSYKDADYTRINTLKETADKLDRSLYTTDSLSALYDAFSAVEYNLSVDKQSQVDLWAEAIEDALQNLEYLPADYSAVEEALETAQKIDRRYYSQISLIRLDNAVNAVDYSLNILEQERVNSFAKAITDALNALEYASVVLRHEECGVIVSATAKEIKPETILSVEEVDPSNYEGTNFAVGGSIRSLHFYDINLLYNAVIVQPDGTVTVKIRLKDGVDPNKCKVYHVTEDIVNPLVRFANTIDGNYIVFETDHFSEFAVIEVETVVDRIEISSLPIKTEYGIGEVLDLSGMKVTAYYSNGTDKVIDDYNVGLVTLDSIGTKVVTVYYTFGNITKTAEFTVTVTVEKSTVDILENDSSVSFVHKKLGFFSLYTKASIQLGINLDLPDEFTVRWSSDNKKVLVDENGKVTCKGLIGAKKANITVEILDKDGKVISSDTVSVIFYKLSLQLSMLVSKAVDIYKKSIVQY